MASAELKTLSALRAARAEFFDNVTGHAATWRGENGLPPLEREDRKLIRTDGVAQIAEFFFVVREGRIAEPDRLRGFLARHNADMDALIASCERGYTETGLSRARIAKAVFTDRQIEYLVHECSGGEARFDQLSLGRIFTQSMAFESCRKLLVLLSETGFLRRQEYNQVLISSKGILEDFYAAHLRRIAANGVENA